MQTVRKRKQKISKIELRTRAQTLNDAIVVGDDGVWLELHLEAKTARTVAGYLIGRHWSSEEEENVRS